MEEHRWPKRFFKTTEENIQLFSQMFCGDATFKLRRFSAKNGEYQIRCCLFFIDGMVSGDSISESIVRPVVRWKPEKEKISAKHLSEEVIQAGELYLSDAPDQVIDSLLSGDTVVFVDGDDRAIVVDTKGFPSRGTKEPENERSIRGPKDGFNESLIPNLALLRRKLVSDRLRLEFLTLGSKSNTKVCVISMDGVTDKRVLEELKRRLELVESDGIFDVNYIQEIIRDDRYTPFKTAGVTERPDVLAAKLLEGRAAIMIDGAPSALTVPCLMIENFQSADDYYINYYFSSVSRMIRIAGFFFSILIPALYVALATHHHEMLPTHLLLAISASREGVPFPTVLEAILLLFAFETLREAGSRTPEDVGTALSIVGALVLGQAAVDARFVSAPMVIIIAFAGITALMAPRLQGAMMIARTALILLAAAFGLYGVILGLAALAIHTAGLSSFGIPLVSFFSEKASFEDMFIRVPWYRMKRSERFVGGKK